MKIRLIPILSFVLIMLFAVKLNDVLQSSIHPLFIKTSIAETTAPTSAEAKEDAKKEQEEADKQQKLMEQVYRPDEETIRVTESYDKERGVLIENVKRKDAVSDQSLRRMTDTEIDILQSLSQRRMELDEREKDLSLRESSLKVLEQNIQGKIGELQDLQSKVSAILQEYQNYEQDKIIGLVKIYEAMKPQDAAKVFDQLEMKILIEIADNMKEAKLAQILSKMDAYKAKEVTVELANRRKLKDRVPQ